MTNAWRPLLSYPISNLRTGVHTPPPAEPSQLSGSGYMDVDAVKQEFEEEDPLAASMCAYPFQESQSNSFNRMRLLLMTTLHESDIVRGGAQAGASAASELPEHVGNVSAGQSVVKDEPVEDKLILHESDAESELSEITDLSDSESEDSETETDWDLEYIFSELEPIVDDQTQDPDYSPGLKDMGSASTEPRTLRPRAQNEN